MKKVIKSCHINSKGFLLTELDEETQIFFQEGIEIDDNLDQIEYQLGYCFSPIDLLEEAIDKLMRHLFTKTTFEIEEGREVKVCHQAYDVTLVFRNESQINLFKRLYKGFLSIECISIEELMKLQGYNQSVESFTKNKKTGPAIIQAYHKLDKEICLTTDKTRSIVSKL